MAHIQSTNQIPGTKVGILLFHGLGGTPAELRFVAHGLQRRGHTVHCPTLAGHGGSSEDLSSSTWQDWYASAERALDEIENSCDRVIVGGLSTGALLALMLAARHPDRVDGLTLYAPTFRLNGWGMPWWAFLFRTVFSRKIASLFHFPDKFPHGIKDPRIRAFIQTALEVGDSKLAGVSHTPGASLLEHHRLVRALRPQLPGIAQPVLIIHPREDDYADLNNAWYLQRTVKGTVEMTVLDDSYHIVTVDRQRHTVVARTAQFAANLKHGFALSQITDARSNDDDARRIQRTNLSAVA